MSWPFLGEPQFYDQRSDVLMNPTLVAEVLFDSIQCRIPLREI
jgi:hypothetical protein